MVVQARRIRLQRKAAWQTALTEHRVVQFLNGLRCIAYNSESDALKAIDVARSQGIPAKEVPHA